MNENYQVLKVLKPFRVFMADGSLVVHEQPGVTMDPLPVGFTSELLKRAPDAVQHVRYLDMAPDSRERVKYTGSKWNGWNGA